MKLQNVSIFFFPYGNHTTLLEARFHGSSIIKPPWKMYQRQFNKTTIYFFKTENVQKQLFHNKQCKNTD